VKIVVKDIDKFNQWIIREGLSKRGLAGKVNMSESTIVQIANGSRNPSPRTAKKICEALQVKFDEIFEIVVKEVRKC